MIARFPDRFNLFREAILKAAQDNPELELALSNCYKPYSWENTADILADLTADGEAGAIVFLGGRELAQKVLDNIPNADDYDVCVLMREAIKHKISMLDNVGTTGNDFFTPTYQEILRQAYAASPGELISVA